MKITARLGGTMNSNLAKAYKNQGRRLENGLAAMGEVILEESNKLVPVDTEALLLSGRTYTVGKGFDAIQIVGYGSPEFPALVKDRKKPCEYAVFVHEIPAKHRPPTQAKFLETAINNKQDELRMGLLFGVNT